jgi:prepilin-type N-terminal cleavage/methylation domain-containing protein
MRKKKGFTMVELLVVVSILAILAALLMPALKKLQDKTKLVACQSNLKNVIALMKMYATDNNGAFPECLGRLYSIYADDVALFDCPGAAITVQASRNGGINDNGYPLKDADYALCNADLVSDGSASNKPAVWDAPMGDSRDMATQAHQGLTSFNVAYVGGHIKSQMVNDINEKNEIKKAPPRGYNTDDVAADPFKGGNLDDAAQFPNTTIQDEYMNPDDA